MRITIIFLAIIFLFSCDDSDGDQGNCQYTVEIDKNDYDSTETNNYTITNAQVVGDCLEITISSSGCDGVSWEYDLYDSGDIAESFPIQRFMRLKLDNKELCLAQFMKTASFNLVPVRTDDGDININLEGWDEFLHYEY